jgi:CRP-like cAMP-binding protein
MTKLEVSDIARSIKRRIREVEEQLKDHKALSDELERLKGALSRLEGGVRSRVDGRRGRQRPVTQRTTAAAPKDTSPARSTNARAPRGQNKTKILAALNGVPKPASEIANETGIKASTIGASLSKLAKAGEVVKADRGYALPRQPRTIGSEHGL